jgi:hypothetical protein
MLHYEAHEILLHLTLTTQKLVTCAIEQDGRFAAYRPTGPCCTIVGDITWLRLREFDRRFSSWVVNDGPNRFVLGLDMDRLEVRDVNISQF